MQKSRRIYNKKNALKKLKQQSRPPINRSIQYSFLIYLQFLKELGHQMDNFL